VRQCLHARLQFNERAEVSDARHARRQHLADLIRRAHGAPRIVQQLLQSERNLPRTLVNAQNLDSDLIAGGDDLARRADARPAHFGHMKKTLDAATQIHEGAELAHRHDPPGQHRASHQ